MIMGILIHAPIVYLIPEVVGNDVGLKPAFVNVIVIWIHMWRMPAFFLLSGFFAVLTIKNKGIAQYFNDRFVRIFVVMLVFVTVQNIIWSTNLLTFWHLWFLYYLTLMSLVLVLFGSKLLNFLNKFLRWAEQSWASKCLASFIIFVCLLICNSLARENGVRQIIPEKLNDIQFASFPYFAMWFLVGIILNERKVWLSCLRGVSGLFFLGIVGILSFFFLLDIKNYVLDIPLSDDVLSIITTTCWIFFLIGFFDRIVKRSTKFLRFLVEISYPVYLVHLTPAMFFGSIMVLEYELEPLQVFLINIVLTSIASLLIYFIFIKFTPLNWIINGYKKSWIRPF